MRAQRSFSDGARTVLSALSVSSLHTPTLFYLCYCFAFSHIVTFLGLMHAQVFAAQFDEDDRATEQKVKGNSFN
jgi:hypothetical protein